MIIYFLPFLTILETFIKRLYLLLMARFNIFLLLVNLFNPGCSNLVRILEYAHANTCSVFFSLKRFFVDIMDNFVMYLHKTYAVATH